MENIEIQHPTNIHQTYTLETIDPMDHVGEVCWRDNGKPLTPEEYDEQIISKLSPLPKS